jgi:hypothetical protein
MLSISTAPPRLYRAFSTCGPPISGVEALDGPAASHRVLGDRAWSQLAAVVHTGLAFHGVIPGANLPVEVFALAATLFQSLPQAARTSLRLQTSFRGVSFSSTAATQTMAGQT